MGNIYRIPKFIVGGCLFIKTGASVFYRIYSPPEFEISQFLGWIKSPRRTISHRIIAELHIFGVQQHHLISLLTLNTHSGTSIARTLYPALYGPPWRRPIPYWCITFLSAVRISPRIVIKFKMEFNLEDGWRDYFRKAIPFLQKQKFPKNKNFPNERRTSYNGWS